MSYEVMSARFGNQYGDCVVLQTRGFGEVHLDPREITKEDAARGRQHHNAAALAAYKTWLAAGNTPVPFSPAPPPPPTKEQQMQAELDAVKNRLAALEGARVSR